MISPAHVEDFVNQVKSKLPKGMFALQEDMEKNLRAALESALRKMNLVTREEFDVQASVLERTRLRLEQLEAQVVALETHCLPPIQTGLATDDVNKSKDVE